MIKEFAPKTDDCLNVLAVIPAPTSLDVNMKLNLYYHQLYEDREGEDTHLHINPARFGYIGLVSENVVRAVGKVCAIITTDPDGKKLKYKAEYTDILGGLTDGRKEVIKYAIDETKESELRKEWDLSSSEHIWFFVEKFYETEFKTELDSRLWRPRYLDLSKLLKTKSLPGTEEIAAMLKYETLEEKDFIS